MIPWKKVVREAWLSGEWPLWNPHLFAGDLLLGSAQSAPFEPLFLSSLLLPMAPSLTYLATIVLFLGGALMFFWMRELDCGEEAALFGAAGWMFGDFLVFFLEWPIGLTWRWMPLIFLGVRRVVRRRDGASTLILAFAFTMAILSGHPETLLHVVALGAVWGLWELISVRPPRAHRVIGAAVLAGAIALGATAMFLLPVMEAVEQTVQHQSRKAIFAAQKRSVPPENAIAQLTVNFVPFRYGWVKEKVAEGAPVYPLPWTSYPGAILFPLALYGLARSRRPEGTILGGIAVASYLFGANAPIAADLLARLPLFDIAINDRLIVGALFSMATLAALGVEAWLARSNSRRMARFFAGWLLGLGILVAALWPSMRAAGLENGFLLREAAFLLVPLALALLAIRTIRAPHAAVALVLLLFLGQRALEVGDEYPTLPARAFYPAVPGLELLPGPYRPYRVVGQYFSFIPQTAAMYGLEDVRGYQAMTLDRWADLVSIWSYDQPVSFNRVEDLEHPFLSFLNVRYAIAPPDQTVPEGWRLIGETAGMKLLENGKALPLAYVPRSIRINIPGEQRLKEMAEETDFAQRGWIDHPTGGAPASEIANGPGQITLEKRGMRSFLLTAEMQAPGWVVMSQAGWKGWRALENGRRVPIRQANHAFLGIHLDRGRHQVLVTYAPLSFFWGLGIAGGTLLLVLGGVVRSRRGNPAIRRASIDD